MKHFKHFLLALLVALTSSVTASAYDFEVDGLYYNTISLQDLTCEVTYKKKTGDYEYSSPYSGDIVIPSTVTYSGKTFSVTTIGEHAFRSCSKLTSVEIGNSVTSIRICAFTGCKSLTSVKIGNSVTKIGKSAFSSCSSLTSVVIPNSVTSIGNDAFAYCTSLTSVEIPNSVTTIENDVFRNCSSLTSVEIPNSVTSIGSCAFISCSSLTSVEIPDSVTTIGGAAFQSCSSLTSVVIGNSVTNIANNAFNGCSGLTSVVIGNSVTDLGNCTFYGCSSLKEITSLAITPPRIYDITFEGVSKAEAVVKVPTGSVAAYQAAKHWEKFWNIVGLNGEGGEGSDDEPETKQCAAPTIGFVDGRLVATSTTEGATCYTSITSNDFKEVDSNEPIGLTGVYNITSYAYADGYQNSETVTATLVWVNPTLEGRSDIINLKAKKAVLIRTQGGNVIISGTERGEGIQLYDADGRQLCSVSAEDGQTVIPCNAGKGKVVIVKIGPKTIEVAM